jgi:deoxyribonuclease-4
MFVSWGGFRPVARGSRPGGRGRGTNRRDDRKGFLRKMRSHALGVHVSVAGGVATAFDRGAALDLASIQLFTRNSNQWKAKPLAPADAEAFRAAAKRTGIRPAMSHNSYLVNLAAADPELRAKSLEAMKDELARAEMLGIDFLVMHPGAHTGLGEEEGLARISKGIDEVLRSIPGGRTRIALENAAGQGTCLGSRFEHLRSIIDAVDEPARLAVCFDTCHAFAAGYDIRTGDGWRRTMDELDRVIGLARLACFHLNDSKKGLGCRVDRHEHIGKGEIGLEAFRALLADERFTNHPKVLETPEGGGSPQDAENLKVLESLIEAPGAKPAAAKGTKTPAVTKKAKAR